MGMGFTIENRSGMDLAVEVRVTSGALGSPFPNQLDRGTLMPIDVETDWIGDFEATFALSRSPMLGGGLQRDTFEPEWATIEIRKGALHPDRIQILGSLPADLNHDGNHHRIVILPYRGTQLSGPVAASCWGPDRLDVFALDPNGRLLHGWSNGNGWQVPQGINPEPGFTDAAPMRPEGATPGGWERIDAIRIGNWHGMLADNNIHPAGGPPRLRPSGSSLTACSWGPDRLDVFLAKDDGWVNHVWYDGRDWSIEEFDLGARTAPGQIAAVAPAAEQIDLFFVHEDTGDVGRLRYRSGWQKPTNSWVVPTGAIAAGMSGPEAFALVTDSVDGLNLYWFNDSALDQADGPEAIPPSKDLIKGFMPDIAGLGSGDLDMATIHALGMRWYERRAGAWTSTNSTVHPDGFKGVAVAHDSATGRSHVLAVVKGHLLHRTRVGGSLDALGRTTQQHLPVQVRRSIPARRIEPLPARTNTFGRLSTATTPIQESVPPTLAALPRSCVVATRQSSSAPSPRHGAALMSTQLRSGRLRPLTDPQVGLAAQTQPCGSVQCCQAERDSRQAVASHIEAEYEEGQRQSGEHEAQELGEPRRPSILQRGWCPDPRPDETGIDLRPQRPLETDERSETKHGNLRGQQAKAQWTSNVNDEQGRGENTSGCPGTEPLEPRIDVTAERARDNRIAGHETSPDRGQADPTHGRPSPRVSTSTSAGQAHSRARHESPRRVGVTARRSADTRGRCKRRD